MNLPVVLMILAFFVLLWMNVPIAFAVGLATLLTMFAVGGLPSMVLMAQRMATGVDSFALLAIPFFILAGHLMGQGGIARRLLNLAGALVGRFPGGLSYVNTLSCMMFGAVSGSAAAAVSSIGGFLIPEMERKGYPRSLNIAVTATSATTGLLIPPSNVMIVYALASGNVSIAAMFMAGILPGVLTGLCLIAVSAVISYREGFQGGERVRLRQVLRAFGDAIWSLLLIVIILGGILSGVFTATEAAAIAVVYALFLSMVVYREVKPRDLPDILVRSGVTTAVVMLLVAASTAMSWIMAYENIPQQLSSALLSLSDQPWILLLLINIVLLMVGAFMDITPAVLIFTPIFLPVALKLGMHPVHFGVMMIANLCIGLCTPPVGTCLFVGCSVGGGSITAVSRRMIPYFGAMIVALMVIAYVPAVSMLLPRLLGLVK
jgi:tripartite ATP-independent transporter DctM subunit